MVVDNCLGGRKNGKDKAHALNASFSDESFMYEQFYRSRYLYENVARRIRESPHLHPQNKEVILNFGDFCLAEGLTRARALKYMEQLHTLGRLIEVPYAQATKKDIEVLMRKVQLTGYRDSYKHDLKVTIKKFFKWLAGGEEYPECVRWIKSGFKSGSKLPEELLSEEEVKRLVLAAEHPRDRALIAVLYDSGCRIGEIGTLQIKHVAFDNYGARIVVNGKTGMRRIRLISSVPLLAAWYELHPLREKNEAPLWCSLGTNSKYEVMSYPGIKAVIGRAARQSGIRKRIYAHLFRHSRATDLAEKLTEAQLKEFFGWTQSSRQAATYVHLSGRNVDDALLRIYGLKKQQDADATKTLAPKACPRCRIQNSYSSDFCTQCGMPFDPVKAASSERQREAWDKVMAHLVEDPEVQRVMIRKIKELNLDMPRD